LQKLLKYIYLKPFTKNRGASAMEEVANTVTEQRGTRKELRRQK